MINSISLSGIKYGTHTLNVNAHNVANVLSREFSKSRVLGQENPTGGVDSYEQIIPNKNPVTDENLLPATNVDLSQEAVNQITSLNVVRANANVLKVSDKMMGLIIDMKA